MTSQSAVAELGRDYCHEPLSPQWLSWVMTSQSAVAELGRDY